VPVYPVVFQPPALTGNYPHMSRRDAPLWERYLRAYAHLWQGFAYDVALGGLEVADPDADDAARLGSVGQALGYLLLAQREPWAGVPLIPCVLTNNVAPDVRWFAEQVGVEMIILPEAPAAPFQ